MPLLAAGLFGPPTVPEEHLQPSLWAEPPPLLSPSARGIVPDAVQDGSSPPLLLDPIDFGALYMQRLAQQQAEGAGAQAPEVIGQA